MFWFGLFRFLWCSNFRCLKRFFYGEINVNEKDYLYTDIDDGRRGEREMKDVHRCIPLHISSVCVSKKKILNFDTLLRIFGGCMIRLLINSTEHWFRKCLFRICYLSGPVELSGSRSLRAFKTGSLEKSVSEITLAEFLCFNPYCFRSVIIQSVMTITRLKTYRSSSYVITWIIYISLPSLCKIILLDSVNTTVKIFTAFECLYLLLVAVLLVKKMFMKFLHSAKDFAYCCRLS